MRSLTPLKMSLELESVPFPLVPPVSTDRHSLMHSSNEGVVALIPTPLSSVSLIADPVTVSVSEVFFGGVFLSSKSSPAIPLSPEPVSTSTACVDEVVAVEGAGVLTIVGAELFVSNEILSFFLELLTRDQFHIVKVQSQFLDLGAINIGIDCNLKRTI